MEHSKESVHRRIALANATSVLRKLATGSIIIMFVGICAYLFLLIIMILF